jgi:hypothetical protein
VADPQPEWAREPGMQARPPRARGALLAGVIVGLVVGGGGVGLGWFLVAGGAGLIGAVPAAQHDVDVACDAVARTQRLDIVNDFAGYQRWTGASLLARSAAEADPRYKDLADALGKPMQIAAMQLTTEGPEVAEAEARAREMCNG